MADTVRDALATALFTALGWPKRNPPEYRFSAGLLTGDGDNPVWAAVADAILADPALRAALKEAIAEALLDHRHPGSVGGTLIVRRDHIASYVEGFDCAAALVARTLPEVGT